MQSSKRGVSRIRQDEDRKNVFKPEPQEGSGLATEARQRLSMRASMDVVVRGTSLGSVSF